VLQCSPRKNGNDGSVIGEAHYHVSFVKIAYLEKHKLVVCFRMNSKGRKGTMALVLLLVLGILVYVLVKSLDWSDWED